MEILYYTNKAIDEMKPSHSIRWLSADDYDVFRVHLMLCGQKVLDEAKWKQVYTEGTIYCGLFIGDQMVSRACVEKYSLNAWEVGDVRTAKQYQGNGFALQICSFALNYILANGKTATMRTEEDNAKMKAVTEKLGFTIL